MEGENSFTDIVLNCIRNESEDDEPNGKVEEFLSNKKEKELFTVTKETKEQYEGFSEDKPVKSFEGLNWRDKNCPGRNKDKEISKCDFSVRSNFATSSDQCNWRIRKDTEQEWTPSEHKRKERSERSDNSSTSSLELWNWRNRNDTEQEQTPSEQERKERRERSDNSSMNSLEGWNWRNRNGSGSLSTRYKDKEIVRSNYSCRSKSFTSSDQCNWRNKKDLGEYEMRRSSQSRLKNLDRSVLSEEALPMKGYWRFKCDSERSSPDGLSEADVVWSALKDLYKENQEIIQFPPSIIIFNEGYSLLRCFTPDCRDIESILKIAMIIRKRIDFPYLIEYFRINNDYNYIYIYTHAGELYKKTKQKDWKLCC